MPHSLKTSGVEKEYVGFVAQPTQKFKTPLSSREASWNDNPDDSGLRNRITIKYKANWEWQKHMAHLLNDTQDLYLCAAHSYTIQYLPQMPKGGPLASAPLLQWRGQLQQMSQVRNGLNRPSLHLC